MKKFTTLVLAATCTLGACKDMKEMDALSKNIEEKYGVKYIGVTNSNNTSLIVTFQNTRYNDSSDEVKQRIAKEIGKIAPGFITTFKVKSGSVKFSAKKGASIVVAGYSVTTSNTFDMGIGDTNQ